MDCVTKCGSGAAMSLVPTVHDVYGDGDMVVILFDAAGRRPISQLYHNTYAWCFRMKDAKGDERARRRRSETGTLESARILTLRRRRIPPRRIFLSYSIGANLTQMAEFWPIGERACCAAAPVCHN